MSGNRISVRTDKTLHTPVEVEIDGVIYPVRMNHETFQKFEEAEKAVADVEKEGKSFSPYYLMYDELQTMTGAPIESVRKLDIGDVKEIYSFIMFKYYGKKIEKGMGFNFDTPMPVPSIETESAPAPAPDIASDAIDPETSAEKKM